MTEESAADRQAAQQAREQEKKWGDSATAVSPDTQRADPDRGGGGASFGGESTRGESAVFGEPATDANGTPTNGNPTDGNEDAEPPSTGYGEEPADVSGESVIDEGRARAAADDSE